MATDYTQPALPGVTASADLSSSQHCMVALSGAKTVALPSAGARVDGVLYNDPVAGAAADVRDGIVRVQCAGNITAGAYITTDAAGKAVTATTTGHTRNGIALEAGAAGRYIQVKRGYYGLVP